MVAKTWAGDGMPRHWSWYANCMPVTRIKSVTPEVVEIAGLLVCERFEVTIEKDDLRFEGVVDVSDGLPRVLSASLDYGEGGIVLAEFGNTDIHIRRCLEQAFIDALAMTSWDPAQLAEGFSPEHEAAWKRHPTSADAGRAIVKRKPGRAKLSDEFLQTAVDKYNTAGWKAVTKPDGTPATERTARRYLSVARERGLAS